MTDHKPRSTRYVTKIVDIFGEHRKTLEHNRQLTIEQIEQWRLDLTEQINSHANQQKLRLEQVYKQHQIVLDTKLKENCDLASAYKNARQSDLFDDLQNASRLLELQVASFTFTRKQQLDFPEVIFIGEQSEKTNLENTDDNTQSDARRRRRLKNHSNNTTGNVDDATIRLSPNYMNSDSKRPNDQVTSTKKAQEKRDKKTLVTHSDESDECPMCFMIFSLTMSTNDRRRHANEHMDDEEDSVSTKASLRY